LTSALPAERTVLSIRAETGDVVRTGDERGAIPYVG
jgi:hypothetical protein